MAVNTANTTHYDVTITTRYVYCSRVVTSSVQSVGSEVAIIALFFSAQRDKLRLVIS